MQQLSFYDDAENQAGPQKRQDRLHLCVFVWSVMLSSASVLNL